MIDARTQTHPAAIAARFFALATVLMTAVMMAAPPTASAQPRTGTQTPEEESASFPVPFDQKPWKIAYRRPEDTEAADWSLVIRRPDGSTAVQTAVPDWAGPPKYRVRATAEAVDGTPVVIAEVYPDKLEASPASVHLQIAWHVDPSGQTQDADWSLIGRVQHSDLEGGTVYVFEEEEDAGTRLLRRATDQATTFCGRSNQDAPTHERYDPKTRRFVQVVDLEHLLADARDLQARLPDATIEGPFTRGVFQWYWASTEIGQPTDSTDVIRPMALGDRRGATGWTVDANRRLRGAYATANVTTTLPVNRLRIVPGLPRSKATWANHGAPSEILVSVSDGRTFHIDIPQVDYRDVVDRRGLLVHLPEPVRTHCLTLVHLKARLPDQPVDGTLPVSLAEVTPMTVVDARTPAETARNLVEAIAAEEDIRRRKRMAHIAGALGSELSRAVQTALTETTGVQRRRIIPLVRHLPSERAVELLAGFFRTLDRDAVEFRPVKRGLAAQGNKAAATIADMLSEFSPNDPKHVDLVRLLGRVGEPEHLEMLIDDLGHGGETVRNARLRAIAAGRRPMLDPLLQSVHPREPGPATRDALKGLYLVGKQLHGGRHAMPPRASVLVELLKHSEDRRSLMLTLRTLRYLELDGAVEQIERRFMDYSDPLVRREAVTALGYIPTNRARVLLEQGLEDPSPDVRIQAVTALDDREDFGRSVDPLLQYVQRETWTPGLRQGLSVLARIETPRTESFFIELIGSRRDEPVAKLAASALIRAERSLPADFTKSIALDASAPAQLRVEMIDLLGLGDQPEGEAFLMMLIDPAWVATRVSDPQVRRAFERRALLSLGRRRSPQARSRLLKMAQTGSDRKLRQHALRALAFYEGEDLIKQLRAWKPKAPPKLRPTVQQTIRIIENRAAIRDVSQEVEESIDDPAETPETEGGKEPKKKERDGKNGGD